MRKNGIEQGIRDFSSGQIDRDIDDFILDGKARNLSKGTIDFYRRKLFYLQDYLRQEGVSQTGSVTTAMLRCFFASISDNLNPGGVHCVFRAVRAFFRWWQEETSAEHNPMGRVKSPKVALTPLEPADISDLKKMLKACERHSFTGDRDRAMILCLLDSGCRAKEFLALNMDDVDSARGSVLIRDGKGGKARVTFLGAKSMRELRRYLRYLPDSDPDQPLWVTVEGNRLTYWGLRQILRRRAGKAGVDVPSVHSFRRAFALGSLRAGMDVYSLQRLMGHSDLSVLRRYLAQTEEDLQRAHEKAGPVDSLL